MNSAPLAIVTVHVESHPKFDDPCLGQTAFLELLKKEDYPPMSLHWLREKDDPRDFRGLLRAVDPRHEIGLHFHSIMDYPERGERIQRLKKEKKLLEDALGRPVNVFSSGHFGMTPDAPTDLQSVGFDVDYSVTPGMTMISSKSSHCRYRPGLPPVFWWQSESGHRILEVPVTTNSTDTLLDAAMVSLRETLPMIRNCLVNGRVLHLTAHSYHFVRRDMRPGHGAVLHRNLFSLLAEAGFSFVTARNIFDHLDADSLPVLSSDRVIQENSRDR
ncbi:MAG: hypothetical protein V1495_09010 [Pseudomonadota bacterium]